MFDIEKFIRPHIKNLETYSSARDEFFGDDEILLDANENPYGNFNRYPDPYQRELKEAIGKLKNIQTGSIFLGNGSDEIIDLIYRVFCEPGFDKAIIFEPTFGMYATLAQINDVELVTMKLSKRFQLSLNDDLKKYIQSETAKLLFICSPNNPTGNLIEQDKIEYLLQNFNGIVVIDEAYIDFSSSESRLPAIDEFPNLIVLQTLSKAWGMAGLRIGMAFASPRIVQYLNKIKPPYNISLSNQERALEQLKNNHQQQKQVDIILAERKRLADTLAECKKVKKVYPSEANFILVEVTDALTIYQELLRQGIVVRKRDKYVENCLRITVGSPRENDLLITALKNLEQ